MSGRTFNATNTAATRFNVDVIRAGSTTARRSIVMAAKPRRIHATSNIVSRVDPAGAPIQSAKRPNTENRTRITEVPIAAIATSFVQTHKRAIDTTARASIRAIASAIWDGNGCSARLCDHRKATG